MPRRISCCVASLLLTALTTGCGGCIERVAPGDVAAGVARLTVRNAGYISKLALNDTACGFENPAVKRAALVQGQAGEPGAVTWKVTNCTIDVKEALAFAPDCVGVRGIVQGKVTVSGTKRILGTITGNAETPVIPSAADALRIELDVTLDGFNLTKTDSPNALTMLSGALHFVVEPRLALSRSLGICSVSTLDLSFSDVRYTDAKVRVAQGDHRFEVDVPSSKLDAQSGMWAGKENSYSGELTVWDSTVQLPILTDPDGLDPAYTRQSYLDSVACDPALVVPVSYTCPSLREQLAHGAARLTVRETGALASLLDADAHCGFSSPQVLATAVVTGTPGAAGSVTFTLPAPCTLTFGSKTLIGTDCTNTKQYAMGTVTLTGTKTLRGVLTGDTKEPVAPVTRDPAELVLSAQFSDFALTESTSDQALRVKSGTLNATVRPRVAIDTRSNICSNTTSIAEMPSLAWQNAALVISNSGYDFAVNVSQASLSAQSGVGPSHTNYLAGTVVSDGVPVSIPPAGTDPILDPSYDEATFVSGFSCAPGFQLAPNDAACSLDNVLATNTARLTVATAGAVASMVQNDEDCGFSALGVKTSPTFVTGDNGQMGTIGWDVSHCRLGQAGTYLRGTDCVGAQSFVMGSADISASRLVKGERNTEYVIFDSIIPRSRDAMTITIKSAALSEFASYTLNPGETQPYAKLVFHSGTLSGTVQPILGERKSKRGTFDVGTPVAVFTNVELRDARASLEVAGKRFDLTIPALRVSAQNGSFNGVSNVLSGAVTLSQTVNIASTALDPSFAQAAFDASYVCTADLVATIPVP